MRRTFCCHPVDVVTPSRPKGALTNTARQSKRAFVLNAAAAALSFVLLLFADQRDWTYWLRLALTLLWATLAVFDLRSWRILERHELRSSVLPGVSARRSIGRRRGAGSW